MTPHEFIAKWQKAKLSERSAYQQHFCDLCDVLGQPKPAQADPEGAWYTFERGVHKTTGQQGWADVWMRGHFGWEYKGKHKDLDAAYQQLLLYREDLENPPLLVVCDLDRFHVHTNFTGTAKQVHRFDLEGLADPQNLDVLRKVFTEPESLRPGLTTESITRHAAERFGILADGMRIRRADGTRRVPATLAATSGLSTGADGSPSCQSPPQVLHCRANVEHQPAPATRRCHRPDWDSPQSQNRSTTGECPVRGRRSDERGASSRPEPRNVRRQACQGSQARGAQAYGRYLLERAGRSVA